MQVLNQQEISEVSGGCAQAGGNVGICLPVGGLLNATGAVVGAVVGTTSVLLSTALSAVIGISLGGSGCKPKC